MHKFEKLGGPDNIGNGKFRQKLICKNCRKVKHYIS